MKRAFHAENLKNRQSDLHIRFIHIVKVGVIRIDKIIVIDVFEVLDVVVRRVVEVLVLRNRDRKRVGEWEAHVVVGMTPSDIFVLLVIPMILVMIVLFVVIVVEMVVVVVVVVRCRVVWDVEVEVKLLQVQN